MPRHCSLSGNCAAWAKLRRHLAQHFRHAHDLDVLLPAQPEPITSVCTLKFLILLLDLKTFNILCKVSGVAASAHAVARRSKRRAKQRIYASVRRNGEAVRQDMQNKVRIEAFGKALAAVKVHNNSVVY